MRLRTFSASSMPKALAEVKAALGDDAIILSSVEKADGVLITAAIDPAEDDISPPAAAKPKPRESVAEINPHLTDQLRYDVQHHLRFHNVPELFIARMMATLSDATIAVILGKGRMGIANESRHFLKLALEHIASKIFQFEHLEKLPRGLMLAGQPGVGKTLAIAKLATQYTLSGKKTVVITTDVQRAGSVDQLKAFTDILGIPLAVCSNKKALSSQLKLAGKESYCLIDTAGCNPYHEESMAELGEYTDLPGIETALVMPAGMDAQEALDSAEAFMQLPIARLAISRADCSRRFGGALSAATAHRLAFCFATDSSSAAEPIATLDASSFVKYLLNPL